VLLCLEPCLSRLHGLIPSQQLAPEPVSHRPPHLHPDPGQRFAQLRIAQHQKTHRSSVHKRRQRLRQPQRLWATPRTLSPLPLPQPPLLPLVPFDHFALCTLYFCISGTTQHDLAYLRSSRCAQGTLSSPDTDTTLAQYPTRISLHGWLCTPSPDR
jgi:hypothetical protein